MPYDPRRHHRRSIRLQGYDYSQPGAYFVTICVQHRRCLFGHVVAGRMELNDAGHMVARQWHALPSRFPTVSLDAFVVMPNHIHSIIIINDYPRTNVRTNGTVGAGLVPAPTVTGVTTRVTPAGHESRVAPTVGDIVGAFKSITTVEYIRGVRDGRWPPFVKRLWQRNYYERIVRGEKSLARIREYILTNPARWHRDRENPAGKGR